MGVYELDTVLKKWKRGDMSPEQAIGQILLLLETLSSRVGSLEKRVREERQSTSKPANGK